MQDSGDDEKCEDEEDEADSSDDNGHARPVLGRMSTSKKMSGVTKKTSTAVAQPPAAKKTKSVPAKRVPRVKSAAQVKKLLPPAPKSKEFVDSEDDNDDNE